MQQYLARRPEFFCRFLWEKVDRLRRKEESWPESVSQPAMLNFQVDDVNGALEKLSAAGVSVDVKREEYDYGRFGWFTDPEGNKVELWQPSA